MVFHFVEALYWACIPLVQPLLAGSSGDSSNHLRSLLQRPISSLGEQRPSHLLGDASGTPVSTTKVWVPGRMPHTLWFWRVFHLFSPLFYVLLVLARFPSEFTCLSFSYVCKRVVTLGVFLKKDMENGKFRATWRDFLELRNIVNNNKIWLTKREIVTRLILSILCHPS